MTQRRVLVIGGGLTGLTAAYRLSQAGWQVTLAERSSQLGGLASGFTLHGHSLEKTYHHLFRTDKDILALVDELGMQSELEWLESSISVLRDGVFHPFSTPLDLLRFKPLSPLSRLRVGLVVAFLQRYRNGLGLARHSASKWMKRWCGSEAHRVIWEPLLRGKFSKHAEEVSMAWLWARIHIRANSREPGGGKERLGYFRNGFAVLVHELERRLRSDGVRIHTDASVSLLVKSGQGWTADLNGTRTGFDHVLFTGSCSAFASLLEASQAPVESAYLAQLRSIRYLGAACLVFTYPGELVTTYWNNLNDPSAPFLVLLRHTRLVPAHRYGGREVYYLGNYFCHDDPIAGESADSIRERWFKWLRSVIPHFDPALAGDVSFFRFKDAQHLVDANYAARIPGHASPLSNLWLANFSQIYPEDRGTNYAVRDGNRAAALINASS